MKLKPIVILRSMDWQASAVSEIRLKTKTNLIRQIGLLSNQKFGFKNLFKERGSAMPFKFPWLIHWSPDLATKCTTIQVGMLFLEILILLRVSRNDNFKKTTAKGQKQLIHLSVQVFCDIKVKFQSQRLLYLFKIFPLVILFVLRQLLNKFG